ncbi:MAG: SpoIIE family protein phosphatase [Synechococcales bacterium]|nr:SpoIIE family protein phosphatase [Synechococcales bacterium]
MPKVLVIDDDPAVRTFLAKSLQGQDYEVIVASDGKTGLDMARSLRPGLIICDWLMPGMDGLSVCRHIKADPAMTTTFFILLSARGEVEDRVKGLDTGADDFLAKPVDFSELRARVRAGLRLHQVSEDLHLQKQILETELHEAADYVRSLLPATLNDKVLIDSRFLPSRQLGGDCFDYFWLDPDFLVMYLLDVSGHGLGAALPSISVLNVLRSQSLPDVNFYQPHAVLKALNETFQMNDQNEKYFTIWYGVYNRTRRQLMYSSGGHPPAILITPTNGQLQVSRLRTPNLPIGMLSEAEFSSDRQTVPPNSILYIFSDGVYETFDYENQQQFDEIWGLDAFVELLLTHSPKGNLDDVLQDIQAMRGKITFPDDLSLLKIEFP